MEPGVARIIYSEIKKEIERRREDKAESITRDKEGNRGSEK